MSSVTVFVRLDYHQAFVQVCVMDRGGRLLIRSFKRLQELPGIGLVTAATLRAEWSVTFAAPPKTN